MMPDCYRTRLGDWQTGGGCTGGVGMGVAVVEIYPEIVWLMLRREDRFSPPVAVKPAGHSAIRRGFSPADKEIIQCFKWDKS